MKTVEPVEMAFFHPNSGTFALITIRPAAPDSPTLRVNVSLRNERGIERWIGDRWVSTWHKWVGKDMKGYPNARPSLPIGWHPCDPSSLTS